MEDWKEVIVARLRDRVVRNDAYELVLSKVDSILESLLRDLKAEYHMKARFSLSYRNEAPVWTIVIEDCSVEMSPAVLRPYYEGAKDIEAALVAFILDHFRFE
jgi:hypothetical protein